ncbi:MAG: ATP/GTP-binding protein, partial [Proteobacteria bacterium]|nr:ATP/GTP-binding protein [Pseudomonadota bacterium]
MGNALADKVLVGHVPSAARVIRLLEDGDAEGRAALAALYPHSGKAQIIGVTGPPGAGKSTLVDRLISAFRKRDKRVGVIAIDPTSPFSGGAILGDRVRMQSHAADPCVFIR